MTQSKLALLLAAFGLCTTLNALAEESGSAALNGTPSPAFADNLQEGGNELLPAGTTESLARDFRQPHEFSATAGTPDRSARTVWVRMFPLTDIPQHDPYGSAKNVYNAELLNPDGFNVYDASTRALVGTVTQLNLNLHGDTLNLGRTSLPLENAYLSPKSSTVSTFRWDGGKGGVQLHGGFVFRKANTNPPVDSKPSGAGQDLWSVINVVSINDYLRGVVPSEVSVNWPDESLRAQAIAARTYAIYEMSAARANGQSYDLDPTTWYQSYRGFAFWSGNARGWESVESIVANDAIDSTGSKVVTYNGEVIKAYFSGNSGGITCTATECLHKDTNPPYLVAVKDAPGVQDGEGGTWHGAFSASGIRSKLKEANAPSPKGSILGLEPLSRGPTGRIWELKVAFSGSELDLDRDQTGTVMGLFGSIHSHLFTLSPVNAQGKQTVVGHGFGHGVGMSQVGAQKFAEAGWNAERILHYFYSNCAVKDLTDLE
jgi:SpoIID/LytB domain protein